MEYIYDVNQGAGGGGGTATATGPGGSAGGGEYVKKNTLTVTAGGTLTVSVAPSVAAGTNGANTTINTTTVKAVGGKCALCPF